MKNIYPQLLIFSLLLFSSCCFDNGNFEIINKSDFDIEALSIQPDSKNHVIKLLKNEKTNLKTCMNQTKTDGSYTISFKNSNTNKTVSYNFGYYSNGSQLEKKIVLVIKNDTILSENDIYLDYKN